MLGFLTGPIYSQFRIAKCRRRLAAEISQIQQNNDVVILSFPKSGRTWHRVMLGHYISSVHGYPLAESLETSVMTRKLGLPVMAYSHGGANFLDNVGGVLPSGDELVASPKFFAGKKVILLLRNPADVVVSAYHHAVFRSKSYSGPISEFVRDDRKGVKKITAAYRRWETGLNAASTRQIIYYEDLHLKPEKILSDNLLFAGLGPANQEAVKAAVEFSSFDKMKEMEAAKTFAHGSMAKAKTDDAAKVRRGKVGGHKDYLSPDDLTYVAEVLREYGTLFGYSDSVNLGESETASG